MDVKKFYIVGFLLALLSVQTNPSIAYRGPQTTRHIGSYRVVKYEYQWKDQTGEVLEILRGKRRLVNTRAHGVWIYSMDKQGESFEIQPNQPVVVEDLTGDGVKDLIVQQWTGGAHCCYTFDIYSLGRTFKHIWHHYAGNGHLKVTRNPRGMALLNVENDHDYLQKGGDLSQLPVDTYIWRNGCFRILSAKKSR